MRSLTAALCCAALIALTGYGAFCATQSPANQLWGATIVRGVPGAHRIALTFDDGPSPPYTDRVLDVLRREHVRATFFVVGRAVERNPSLARRIVAEGNAIGNHSWDHAHLIALSPAALRAELLRTDRAIAQATGARTALMRPPFGQRDFAVMREARALGLAVVMWSEPLSGDWEQPGAAAIARRVLQSARDGDIIVLHDGDRGRACDVARTSRCDRAQDVAATVDIINGLRARGFHFVTVPELIGANLALTRSGARRTR